MCWSEGDKRVLLDPVNIIIRWIRRNPQRSCSFCSASIRTTSYRDTATTKKCLEELGIERPIRKRQLAVIVSASTTLTSVPAKLLFLAPTPEPKSGQPAP